MVNHQFYSVIFMLCMIASNTAKTHIMEGVWLFIAASNLVIGILCRLKDERKSKWTIKIEDEDE